MSNTHGVSSGSNPLETFLESRVLWLNSQVDEESMFDITSKMLLLAAEDSKADIFLIINSPGGSVTSGLMLIDVINSIPNDVVTVGSGMCASMGQLFLTAGESGKRYITKHARVMMHQPSGGIAGTETDIATEAALIEDMKHQLAGITAAKTGKTVDQINQDGDRDRWFTAEQALEYGFVDHIVESILDVLPIAKTAKKNKKAREDAEKHIATMRKLEVEKLSQISEDSK